jgi:hypothetical protein
MAEMLLGLAGPLIGGALSASAAGQSALIQMMALQQARKQADDQMRMASATRTDAYGNQQHYNSATNTWESILTPTQKQIVGGGEQEQLKQLTIDAPRNRRILEEARQRGIEAIPDYNKALAGFRYDEAPSRAADEDKLASLLSLQTQDAAGKQTQDVSRTLLRQGRGADLPNILKAADDAQGRNIGGNLVKAYEASIPQYQQDVQARQSRYLPVLKQLQETMAGGGSAPPRFSTTPQELNALQSQQAQLVQSALASGGQGVNAAFQGLAKSIGDTGPDLKGIASLLSAVKGKQSNTPQYGLVPNQLDNTNTSSAGFDDSQGTDYSNVFSDF